MWTSCASRAPDEVAVFIEMLDLLRCPVEHEETWLVASFAKIDGRFVIEGKLGCPVCAATYAISGGVARFSDERPAASRATASDEDAVRYAAMLGLSRPGSLGVLEGESINAADRIAELTESRVICLNPPEEIADNERIGLVTAGDRVPLASASVDGLIVEDQSRMGEAARLLRRGGRLVAPASLAIGGPFRELARDERFVVAESVGDVVPIQRAGAR